MIFTGILIGLLIAIALGWVWKTYNMNEKASRYFKKLIGDRPDDRK